MFEQQCDIVFESVSKSSKYITSSRVKGELNVLTEKWKVRKKSYEEHAGAGISTDIEDSIKLLEKMSSRHHFERKTALGILKKIRSLTREYHLKLIETTGSDADDTLKFRIRAVLVAAGYDTVNAFLKDAEAELIKPDYPEVCHQLRLTLEEYLRVVREKLTRSKINGGTVGDHLKYFATKQFLDEGDTKFVHGYHQFLCEKGSHSTQARKRCDKIDAKFAFMHTLNLIDFLIANGCY